MNSLLNCGYYILDSWQDLWNLMMSNWVLSIPFAMFITKKGVNLIKKVMRK